MKDNARALAKTWLVLLAVFALGCITGAGLGGVYRTKTNASLRDSRQHKREVMFEKIRHDLNLNDEQSKEIRRVLDETAGEFRRLRGELRPKYDELRLTARGRMRALLTAEQQQKFDALMAEFDARRQSNDGGH